MRGSLLVILCAAGCGRVSFGLSEDAQTTGSSDVLAVDAEACLPPSGMLAAYTLDESDAMGGMLADASGNGHTGGLQGTVEPQYVAGKVGQALDFATADAFMTAPTIPLDATPGGFTSIALWYRHDGQVVDEGVLALPTRPAPGPPRYSLWLNTTNGAGPSLCINTGSSECWGVTDPGLLGRWVHLVAIYANGPETDGQLYIDGVAGVMACQFGTCDQSRVALAPFELGSSDTSYTWHGILDEVRVFARALTPAEIATLYACGG